MHMSPVRASAGVVDDDLAEDVSRREPLERPAYVAEPVLGVDDRPYAPGGAQLEQLVQLRGGTHHRAEDLQLTGEHPTQVDLGQVTGRGAGHDDPTAGL